MGRKGVSTIIAEILMLVIVISLAAFAYSYIYGVFTSKTATVFTISYTYSDTVAISNDGTAPITSFKSFTVDGRPVSYLVIPQDTSLAGYWKLDEGTGTSAGDSSGYGNNGNFNDAPTWVDAKFGKGLSFDGVNDYVNVGGQPIFDVSPGQAKTFSSWFKAVAQTKTTFILWKEGGCIGWWIDLQTDGNIRLNFNTGNNYCTGYVTYYVISSDKRYDDGNWHHVAGVIDRPNSVMKLYIDSQLKGTASIDNTNSGTGGELRFATNWNNGSPLNGTLDEIRIYNRTLSADEIKGIYSMGGQINAGTTATIKIYNQSSSGTHTIKICTSNTCQVGYLTIV